MLSQSCNKVVNYLIRQNLLQEDLRSWYEYALQTRIATFTSVLCMIFLGSLFVSPFQVICFLLGILPLRKRLGGYHAKTPAKCLILSLSVMLLCLVVVKSFIHFYCSIFIWIAVAGCSPVLFHSVPYGVPNLHLTQDELDACWLKMKKVLCIELIFMVFLQISFPQTDGALFCGIGIIAASVSFFVCERKE